MRETEDSSSLYNSVLENKHIHRKKKETWKSRKVQLLHNGALKALPVTEISRNLALQ